jgi:phosphomevalonate kinase
VITADAPGKLVIIGEYAVLAGAPGIAVAVDVRAEARIGPSTGSGSCLVIPETAARHPFRWLPGALRWEGALPGAFGRPLEAVLETLRAHGYPSPGQELPASEVVLTTAAFHQTDARGARHKLGLGSSAAVTVALLGALLRLWGAGSVGPGVVLGMAWDAHRRLQGGAGSGIDIATAIAGGVTGVEYRAAASVPEVVPLAWPGDLHCLAIATGVSASTPAMLGRLAAFSAAQPAAAASQLQRLGAASTRALAAWRSADVPGILNAVAVFAAGLRQLDAAAGIGIWSPEHLALASLADVHGVHYKPSGAGGGDYGIALAAEPAALQALRVSAEAAGYRCLDHRLGAPGLRVQGQPAEQRLPPGGALA